MFQPIMSAATCKANASGRKRTAVQSVNYLRALKERLNEGTPDSTIMQLEDKASLNIYLRWFIIKAQHNSEQT